MLFIVVKIAYPERQEEVYNTTVAIRKDREVALTVARDLAKVELAQWGVEGKLRPDDHFELEADKVRESHSVVRHTTFEYTDDDTGALVTCPSAETVVEFAVMEMVNHD